MAEAKKRLVVIDGKSVFYRGYYAMPNLSLSDGTPTGGVYGFAMMALDVLKKFDPDYVCVAWDKAKTNIRRRRDIYPEYKANRKPAPPDFYEQVPILHELLEAFNWPLYEIDDHEADDIMGTFAVQAKKKGIETVLISSDKDLLQLINSYVTVAALKKGITNVELFDKKHFEETYQMTTQQFIDYKSLRGDPSDNLPGVAGVGEKTAKDLISEFGSLDEVYRHLDDIRPAVKKKLEQDRDMAYLTKKLVILDKDVPLKLDFEASDINRLNPAAVSAVLKKLEFRTLLRQLPKNMKEATPATLAANGMLGEDIENIVISDKNDLGNVNLETDKYLVVDTVAVDRLGKELRAIVLSDKTKRAFIFDLGHGLRAKDVVERFKAYLEADNIHKIGFDLKSSIRALTYHGVRLGPVGHDVKVGAFLIDPLSKGQTLNKLAQDNLAYGGPDIDSIAPDETVIKMPLVIDAIWSLYKIQINELDKLPKVAKLATDIEWPVIKVLAEMELNGIRLDRQVLKKMSVELEDSISDVKQSIYGYANEEFNISSPGQLSKVLFEQLKLPTSGIRRTQTNYSTAASELAKLTGKHPIIGHIAIYRELAKLKNTYVDTLPELVASDGRVHTTFSLSTAATGRLSSHDPNLQNIPVRSKLGRRIRNAFVPDKGSVFISADYSQFELRLAAVLAGDDDMITAFNEGADIHRETAAQMFGVRSEEVTKEQRHSAKAVNFGVMYGQGTHGLSEGTGMRYDEAKDFIDKYFEVRHKLRDYLEALKEQAKTAGFVETLFGRRRPTPDVNSSNFIVREAAKRAAINMPIQGTAADIMKLAMVNAGRELPRDCRILLQIHDSLLVECPEGKAKTVSNQLKTIMEDAYKLPVKLRVDVSTGNNWGEI